MLKCPFKDPHGRKRVAQINLKDKTLLTIFVEIKPRFHHGHLIYLTTNKAREKMLKKKIITDEEAKKISGLMIATTISNEIITAYHPSKNKWKQLIRLPVVNIDRMQKAS